MRFVLENAADPHAVAEFLKKELPRHFTVQSITVEDGEVVIRFDPSESDFAMRVLTSVFEGTGAEFYCPDLPGMRWTVA